MATTLSFNPFNNLGEQIEYGALANSCGFGQDESKSSFRCIADEMIRLRRENRIADEIIRLRKENEALKSQLAADEEEEEEHTEEDTIAEFNKEADLLGATAQQREYGLAMMKTAFKDEDPVRKAMTLTRDAITRVVKENEYLKAKLAEKEKEEEEEELCCVICDCELDEAAGEVCRRDWEGEYAPMCACCWDDKEAEEDADEETDEE